MFSPVSRDAGRGRVRTRAGEQAGVILILTAMLLVVLLGITAVAIDLSGFEQDQRQAQGAADAGALAAAQDLPTGTAAATTDARTYVSTNDSGLTVGVTTPYDGNSNAAEVDVSKTEPVTFGAIFGVSQANVSASAVAVHDDQGQVSDGNFGSPWYCYVFCEPQAGSSIGPWKVVSGNVDLSECTVYSPGLADAQPYFSPPPGDAPYTYVIDMNGDVPGSITQTVTTIPGEDYHLSFKLSGNPSWDQTYFTMDVDVGGSVTPFQWTNPAYGNDWGSESISFVATASTTTITFTSTSYTPYPQILAGPMVADVNVYGPGEELAR